MRDFCLWGQIMFIKFLKWLYKDLLSTKAPYKATNNFEPIAHAGGAIDDKVYTNSKEALLKAIEDGYKFIEIDLRKSLGGSYFGAHKITEFNEITGHKLWSIIPPTLKQIKSRKIYNKFTPILLTEIAEILKEHPDVVLVTDKAEDYKQILKEFPLKEQLVVEVTSFYKYIKARKAGIKYVALNTADFDFVRENNISMVVTTTNVDLEEANRYTEEGNNVLIATYAKSNLVPSIINKRNFFAYIDTLIK